ncbi:hypothetical protein AB6A40_001883 [Gnathostoma spinigerum]|uniref:Hexosyltransferase n=1 Tax=Gnathostoma spinigerum TaxID=75299 RepID=A0ABD6EAL6_9BILA
MYAALRNPPIGSRSTTRFSFRLDGLITIPCFRFLRHKMVKKQLLIAAVFSLLFVSFWVLLWPTTLDHPIAFLPNVTISDEWNTFLKDHIFPAAYEGRKVEAWKIDFKNEEQNCLIFDRPDDAYCEGVTVLLGVLSMPSHRSLRTHLRSLHRKIFHRMAQSNVTVKIVFIIGEEANSERPLKMLRRESYLYGDLLLTSITESYRNLYIKSYILLQYHAFFCSDAPFLTKMDDDVVIGFEQFTRMINKLPKDDVAIYGRLNRDAIVGRDERSKWYVPVERYSPPNFPVYSNGLGYIISRDAVKLLLLRAVTITSITIEDALITGIVASAAGVPRRNCEKYVGTFLEKFPEQWPCDDEGHAYLAMFHLRKKFSPETFDKFHKKISELKCSLFPFPIFWLFCRYFNFLQSHSELLILSIILCSKREDDRKNNGVIVVKEQ